MLKPARPPVLFCEELMRNKSSHCSGQMVQVLYFSTHMCSLCTYQCQAPPTPGWAEVRIGGDLQMLDDKFP